MTSASNSQIPLASDPSTQDLHTLKSHLNNDISLLQEEISSQMVHKLSSNKQQVLFAITELNNSLKKRLGEALFTIFNSFTENIRDSDLESLDISNWITTSLNLFETQLGALPVNQDKVLEVVNDFTHTWTSKVHNISRLSHIQEPSFSDQPMSSFQEHSMRGQVAASRNISDIKSSPTKTERESGTSEKAGTSPKASQKKGSLFGKMKNLLSKSDKSQGSEGPTQINLGNEKNFSWDPIKKRYKFDDEEEQEEEKDEGPPPSMTSSQQRVQKPAENEGHSLIKPTAHRSLAKKKEPSKSQTTEARKPAFMPNKFIPSSGVTPQSEREDQAIEEESQGVDLITMIIERVETIFNQMLEEKISPKGIERLRTHLRGLDHVSLSNKTDEAAKEARLLALESEFESTQASFLKESYTRRLLESELSSIRESYQQNYEKEYELQDNVKDLERALSMYKDLYNSKSQVWSLNNSNQAQAQQQRGGLVSEKKKLLELETQLRRSELQAQEHRTAANLSNTKYSQVLEYLNQENSVSFKLRAMLEDSFKAQREQDELIIGLKKEALELVGQYGSLFEENQAIIGEKSSLEASLDATQTRITELTEQLRESNDRLRIYENDQEEKGKELSEFSKRIHEITAEKQELERRLQEESEYRSQVEERLQEESSYRSQLEVRIQDEQEYRRQVGEKLGEEELFRGKLEIENQEFSRRVEELIAEKEGIERRFDESNENERRMRAHLEDVERQLNSALQEKDNMEREIRKEREKMLEELMENKSQNQLTAQEKELLSKFSEEVRGKNLSLERNIQSLTTELNKLRSEKQKSIETILQFVREIRATTTDATDEQGFESLENYMTGLLRGTEEASERHFRALGVLPQVRESLVRELEFERARKSIQADEVMLRLRSLEKERELFGEQSRQYVAEIQSLKGILEVVKQQNEQAEYRINELYQETEQLKRENEESEQRNIMLERSMQEQEAQLGESMKNMSQYQQYQASSLDSLENQLKQFDDVKQELARIQAQLENERGVNSQALLGLRTELEEQITKLKEENQELQQQLDEGFEQYTFLQGKTREVLEQLKQAKEENAALSQEHSQSTNDSEILRQEIVQLRFVIENLEQRNADLLEKESTKQTTENTQNLQAAAELEAGIAAYREQISALEREIQVRDQEIRSLQERLFTSQQSSEETSSTIATELYQRTEELTRLIQEKDTQLQELAAFREEALVNIKALEEGREQALGSFQAAQNEKEEALANLRELQTEQERLLSRLVLLESEKDNLEGKLYEEETKTFSMNNILEQAKGEKDQTEADYKELTTRIVALEEEISKLVWERDGLAEEKEFIQPILKERENLLEEREFILHEKEELRRRIEQLEFELAEGVREKASSSFPEGEDLWEEIEREYSGSRVMDYLSSMKPKLEIQRNLSAGKLVSLMLREFEEAIGELSRELEEKETTLIGLTRSLDEMNEQCQKLQNNMTVLEGEHSEKEDYSSIRELYEKKTKRVEELLKELATRNVQIEEMNKVIERLAAEKNQDDKDKGQKGGDLKEENSMLREEIAKEKERSLKITKEFENYKEKSKNSSEERGQIQHSYSQIIKNLSIQLDELKKKKGIPTAVTVAKSTQTGEEDSKKGVTVEEENPQQFKKGQGFLSGMAKFFLTDGEVRKI